MRHDVQQAVRQIKRGVPTVRWDHTTLELIKSTVERQIAEGLLRPAIRSVLYKLIKAQPGWSKSHYTELTRKLGQWRDAGLFPYGVLSDSSGGQRARPHTRNEIAEQLRIWRRMKPAMLRPDGYLRALLIEHEDLVQQIEYWCDDLALVVSSAGQLRRENLWTAVAEWKAMAAELGAKGIIVYALMDRDDGGNKIYEAHRRWFKQVVGLDLELFGLTDAQLRHVGLTADEDWQIDGVIGLDPAWWRRQIRALLRGPNPDGERVDPR
jgi:hypothetical protein